MVAARPIQVSPLGPLYRRAGGTTIGCTVMKKIRVVLMAMRPRLRDILTDALSREPDMDVIEWRTGPGDELIATRPDVMVFESADPLDIDSPTRLLRAIPTARVLVVADAGDQAAVFELRPTRTVMGTVGMQHIITAIRSGLAGGAPTLVPESADQGTE